jgi:hypothetical protein
MCSCGHLVGTICVPKPAVAVLYDSGNHPRAIRNNHGFPLNAAEAGNQLSAIRATTITLYACTFIEYVFSGAVIPYYLVFALAVWRTLASSALAVFALTIALRARAVGGALAVAVVLVAVLVAAPTFILVVVAAVVLLPSRVPVVIFIGVAVGLGCDRISGYCICSSCST